MEDNMLISQTDEERKNNLSANDQPDHHEAYFGFRFIPGFSRYMVNSVGRIFDMKRKRFVKGHFSKGYISFILVSDTGKKTSMYRHRAICLAFLPDDRDLNLLQVNHINGIKGDDRLENLEWCTCSENRKHAIYTGLTCVSKPVACVNIATEEIRVFGSLVNCCTELGLNEKKVSIALRSGDFIYRIGLLQLRYIDENHRSVKRTNLRPVLVRNMKTNVVLEYESIAACAEALGMTKHNVFARIENPATNIYRDYLQIKRKSDNTPWYIPKDLDRAYIESSPTKAVLVRYCRTNEVVQFDTQRIASKALGIAEATIHQWLSMPGQPVLKLPKNSSYIQIKRLSDFSDWRIPIDYVNEFENLRLRKPVLVKFIESEEVVEFESAKECAKKLNILPTTLNQRLKSKGQRKFKPGIYVKYKHEPMAFLSS